MSTMPFPRGFSLLTPLLWGAAMFLLLLAVRSVLRSRSSRKRWDMETIEWGRRRPSLIQRWRVRMGRIRFRLPRSSHQQILEIAPKPASPAPAPAPGGPLTNPVRSVLNLFGSTIGAPEIKPKEAFAWEKTKGIE